MLYHSSQGSKHRKLVEKREKGDICFSSKAHVTNAKERCYTFLGNVDLQSLRSRRDLEYDRAYKPMDGGAWQATVHGVAKQSDRT